MLADKQDEIVADMFENVCKTAPQGSDRNDDDAWTDSQRMSPDPRGRVV